MRDHLAGIISTAFLLWGAVAACGPRSDAPVPAESPVLANNAPDSIPGYKPEEEFCGFVEAKRHWTPSELVNEYVRRDADGEFLSSNPWLDTAMTCAGHLPGWDEATLISDFTVRRLDSTDLQVSYQVLYSPVGLVSGGEVHVQEEEGQQIVNFQVVRTPWGWRIAEPQMSQHVLGLAAIASLGIRGDDSVAIERVMTPRTALPLQTLLLPGEDWISGYDSIPWLGVFDAGPGKWELRSVRANQVLRRDECRGGDVRLVDFDRPGVRFAVAASTGLREGGGYLVSNRQHYVPPGDSVVLGRPIRGSFQLFGRGREEIGNTGRVVRDYSLSVVSEDGEHATGAVAWEGQYSDLAPSVQWIGDLNQDGFPDVLLRVPKGTDSRSNRLMLSADGEEMGYVYRAAGESLIFDC